MFPVAALAALALSSLVFLSVMSVVDEGGRGARVRRHTTTVRMRCERAVENDITARRLFKTA